MPQTPNQKIEPITAKINSYGHLEIGGCDVVELAKKYGTPVYVYDEKTIRAMCRAYKDAFKIYPKVNFQFASKALMVKTICKLIASEGFGFDCVSGGELYTAKTAGVDMSKSLFNGNNKTFDELNMAIEYGVGHISVDNFYELQMLDKIAKSHNRKVEILLRITPGIECHTHEYIQTGHLDSKFGFDLTQIDSVIELLQNQYNNLELKGLHAHIGSQIFETKVYYDEVDVILKEIRRIKDKYGIILSEINLGGGLGVCYTDEDAPPSVYEIADVIIKSVEENSKKYGLDLPTIYLEPGRSIVANAGVTLYTLGSSKQVPNGKKYIAADGGMADNARPITYGAKYNAVLANKADLPADEVVTVGGRFCESGDILIKDIKLPSPNEGDILCVFTTGAYGYSMSSNYNRVLKPAMVLVNDGQSDMILLRESYEHLVSLDLIPDRFI